MKGPRRHVGLPAMGRGGAHMGVLARGAWWARGGGRPWHWAEGRPMHSISGWPWVTAGHRGEPVRSSRRCRPSWPGTRTRYRPGVDCPSASRRAGATRYAQRPVTLCGNKCTTRSDTHARHFLKVSLADIFSARARQLLVRLLPLSLWQTGGGRGERGTAPKRACQGGARNAQRAGRGSGRRPGPGGVSERGRRRYRGSSDGKSWPPHSTGNAWPGPARGRPSCGS